MWFIWFNDVSSSFCFCFALRLHSLAARQCHPTNQYMVRASTCPSTFRMCSIYFNSIESIRWVDTRNFVYIVRSQINSVSCTPHTQHTDTPPSFSLQPDVCSAPQTYQHAQVCTAHIQISRVPDQIETNGAIFCCVFFVAAVLVVVVDRFQATKKTFKFFNEGKRFLQTTIYNGCRAAASAVCVLAMRCDTIQFQLCIYFSLSLLNW